MAAISEMGTKEPGGAEAGCVPLVVAITGASGSGKTPFAARLHERLGNASVLISHDDYYKHCPEMCASRHHLRHVCESPSARRGLHV